MKKLIFSLLIIFFAFTFISCEDKEDRKERQENEKTALEYSCKYIEEKYNFKPEIIKYESDYQQGIFGRSYYPRLLVEMSYNNREFLTYINYDGTNGHDSYQHEDIKAALSNTINEQISGLKDLNLFASHDIDSNTYIRSNTYCYDFYDCLCSTYFDGTNLDSVLSECNAYYRAYYVNKNFPNLDILPFSDSVIGSFVSYRSEEAMKRLPNLKPAGYLKDAKKAQYVECMQKTNGYHTHFNLNHFDMIDYICVDASTNKPYELKSISLVPPFKDDHEKFDDLTDTYMIGTDTDIKLFVYFPIHDNLYTESELLLKYKETDETKLYTDPIDIRGDYAVANVSLKKNSTLSFCLANRKRDSDNRSNHTLFDLIYIIFRFFPFLPLTLILFWDYYKKKKSNTYNGGSCNY